MPPGSGVATREKLLDAAESMINRQGYAATSIDRILEKVGMTKGTFFYHFKTKAELARALIDRFAASDRQVLHANMKRAEKLDEDPLQQLLIFVGLLIEVAEGLDESPQPGCLFATYCFESGLFEEETHAVIRNAMLEWRRVVSDKIRAACEKHPPRSDVDVDGLADMITVLFEGSFVMSRTFEGPGVFAAQLRHYRDYLRLVFDA